MASPAEPIRPNWHTTGCWIWLIVAWSDSNKQRFPSRCLLHFHCRVRSTAGLPHRVLRKAIATSVSLLPFYLMAHLVLSLLIMKASLRIVKLVAKRNIISWLANSTRVRPNFERFPVVTP